MQHLIDAADRMPVLRIRGIPDFNVAGLFKRLDKAADRILGQFVWPGKLRIGRALTLQKASPEWQAGIGIPHASTYLNQQRWTDEKREITEAAPVQASEPTGAIDTSGLRFV